ncbi:MAG: Rieske 2Fe-2S domain-containing protein, partial [Mycobacteriales bacterium]
MNAQSVPVAPVYPGWYLLAFAADLGPGLTPLTAPRRPLVAVRESDRIRVFDATCPHRGAHLGYGGKLDGDWIGCPFHGRRVHLGLDRPGPYRVAEHASVLAGEALFVRYGDGPDLGFEAVLTALAGTHRLVAGFTVELAADPQLVIENAFDPDHFVAVHGLSDTRGMTTSPGPDGELRIDGELEAPRSTYWDAPSAAATRIQFFARAFSPALVVTRLGPAGSSPVFFTGTVPTPTGCVARVAMAVPPGPGGE